MARQVFDDKFTYEAPQLAEPLIYQHPYEVIADTIRNQGFAEATREDAVNSLPDTFNIPHLEEENDAYNALVTPWQEEIDDIAKAYVAGDPDARERLLKLGKNIKDSRTNGELFNMGLRNNAMYSWAEANSALQAQDPDSFREEYEKAKKNILEAKTPMDIAMVASDIIPTRPDINMEDLIGKTALKMNYQITDKDGNTVNVSSISNRDNVGGEINSLIASTPGMAEYMMRKYGKIVPALIAGKDKEGRTIWEINPELDEKDQATIGNSALYSKEQYLKQTSSVQVTGYKDPILNSDDKDSGNGTGGGSSITQNGAPLEHDMIIDATDTSNPVQIYNANHARGIVREIGRINMKNEIKKAPVSPRFQNTLMDCEPIVDLIMGDENINYSTIRKRISAYLDKIGAKDGGSFKLFGFNFNIEKKKTSEGYMFSEIKMDGQRIGVSGLSGTKTPEEHIVKAIYEKGWKLDSILSTIRNTIKNNEIGMATQVKIPAMLIDTFKTEFEGSLTNSNFAEILNGELSRAASNKDYDELFVTDKLNTQKIPDVKYHGRNRASESVDASKFINFVVDFTGSAFSFQNEDGSWVHWNPNEETLNRVLEAIKQRYPKNTLTYELSDINIFKSMMYLNGMRYEKTDGGVGKRKTVKLDNDFMRATGINLDRMDVLDENGKKIDGNYFYEFNATDDGTNQYSLCFKDKNGKKVVAFEDNSGKSEDMTFPTIYELVSYLKDANINNMEENQVLYNKLDSRDDNFQFRYNQIMRGKRSESEMDNYQKMIYRFNKSRKFDNLTDKGFAKELTGLSENEPCKGETYQFASKANALSSILSRLEENKMYACDVRNESGNVMRCVINKFIDNMGRQKVYIGYYDNNGLVVEPMYNQYGTLNDIRVRMSETFGTNIKSMTINK